MIGSLILIGGWRGLRSRPTHQSCICLIGSVILLGLGIVTGVSRTSYRAGGDVTVVRHNDRI
ncbi:MAG: hypothetical protein H0X73_07135 [Chthoniobacterales bacterium]|nr:hypothetical protein [Chthoniobacterales bacterium]